MITAKPCSVIGTGENGTGSATCADTATISAPRTIERGQEKARLPAGSEPSGLRLQNESRLIGSDPFYREGHRVPAAETERSETGALVAISHRVEQRRQHPGAACADRVAQ